MSQHTDTNGGWIARWREHRRAKRQETLERRFYHLERARSTGVASPDEDLTTARAYARGYPTDVAGPWGGMLGDVGGRNPNDGDKS